MQGIQRHQQKNRQALPDGFGVGWMTGFEPATSGTTIQYSNQLSYTHRLGVQIYKKILFGNLFREYLLTQNLIKEFMILFHHRALPELANGLAPYFAG